ncbi:RecT family recombinase [Cohnella sp. 56]|uniref:RecT family recombinase n=1 Tax=Cohnella sp. 56 TaxID=3113722 RepID=UPI0030E947DC
MAQQNSQLSVIHKNLDSLLESKREAMPSGFNKTRFLQNSMAVLQDTYNIEKYEPTSVARTMLKGAFLGLDFFNKECYAVPYGNTLQFQTDYKGEKKLAKKYSVRPVKDIYAKVVREGDEFIEEIVHGKPSVSFKPKSFNNGEILGAFAVVLYVDGTMDYDTMTSQDIEDIKNNFSKKNKDTGQFSKAWTIEATKPEMYKKTVLRRLCKNIELDFDTIEQKKAFEDAADMDFNQDPKPKQQSPFNPSVVEAEYEVLPDAADQG